jgi:hypothetical protein
VKPGHFVVGSFFASDNTCEICGSNGYEAMDERRAIKVPLRPSTDYLRETSRAVFRRSLLVIGDAMVVDLAG